MVSRQVLVASSAGLAFIVGYHLLQTVRKGKKHKLPPRVPSDPTFGNALRIFALRQGPWVKGLAEEHGKMFVLCGPVFTSSTLMRDK